MKDGIFKQLSHHADKYEVVSTGQQIAQGYKPDVMLKNENKYIIMECETNTTRKGYIGAMVKAAKFLSGDKTGVAVIVLKEKQNTTVKQIYKHLAPYFEWLKGLTNMQAVYIISTDNYCPVDTPLKIFEKEFIQYAKVIE